MKIRHGFVSNSSSSSFIVQYKDTFLSPNHCQELTRIQMKKLQKYGFFKIGHNNSGRLLEDLFSFMSDESIKKHNKPSETTCHFGYIIVCNQDEVIEFLIRLGVSFHGCIEYGTYHVFYDKDTRDLVTRHNFGADYEMYENSFSDKVCKVKKEKR